MADRVHVRFGGDGSGVEDLTWGQRDIWRSTLSRNSSMLVVGVRALPAGSTVGDMASALRFSMSRHQSLRTRLRLEDPSHPRQELSSSGETVLEVLDADGVDPAEVAETVHERYQRIEFDHERDWPIRMAVIQQDGVAVYLVAAYNHLAIDAYGIDALAADLAARDPVTGRAAGPPGGVRPMELARQQRTPAALRQSLASIRYWERVLRSLPTRPPNESADPRTPRYWRLAYTSVAAHRAVLAVAARTGTHPGPVLFAAFLVALARVTGNHVVAVQTLVHNRFRPGFTGSVSALAQLGLCVVDVANSTFDEVVGRAWRATTRAGKHAYYDPDRLAEMIAALSLETGVAPDISCFYNDRGRHIPRHADRPPTRADVLTALPRTTMRWGRRLDDYDREVSININDVPDALDCVICVDTHRIAPAQLVALARGVEAVVVAAALDPAAPTGVPVRTGRPVSRPAGPM